MYIREWMVHPFGADAHAHGRQLSYCVDMCEYVYVIF